MRGVKQAGIWTDPLALFFSLAALVAIGFVSSYAAGSTGDEDRAGPPHAAAK